MYSSHNRDKTVGGLLDNNTYYPVKNIVAYPASNSVDTGKLLSELNIRNITINITDMNFVVSPNPGGYDISFLSEEQKIQIEPGKAIINGFEVLTDIAIKHRLPKNTELYTGDKYAHKYAGMALLCLHTVFDSLNNLSGNVQVGTDWLFEGIHACYPTAEEYENAENEYLLLGGVTPDGKIRINDEKFYHIDAEEVLARLEPDDETGVPPKQSTNVLEFINQYLHSYWVSKAGDHEYGNLTLRKRPAEYLEPGFKYQDEEPLADQKYAVKIARNGIDCAKDDNPQFQEGYLNIKYCDAVGDATKYEKHTELWPLCTYLKDNISDDSTDYNVFMGYITDVKSKPTDYKQTIDAKNTYLNRITNIAKTADTIGETYLNLNTLVQSGCFIWDGEGFTQNRAQKFKIQFTPGQFYVGSVDRTKYVQNDLFSIEDSITTMFKNKTADDYFRIDISAIKQNITFNTKKQTTYIRLRDDEDIANTTDWTNVMNMGDNVEIDHNLWTKGYIVAGTKKNVTTDDKTDIGIDPSLITVPDFANVGNYRKIQEGDVVATQIWTSVYNDISEIFDFVEDVTGKDITGLVVAQDSQNLSKFRIADTNNTNVVGIVSENPGLCLGGYGCEHGVPVALNGRVKARYEGELKPGDFVGLSFKVPGHVTKCDIVSPYRCGKVLEILDDNFIKILVTL